MSDSLWPHGLQPARLPCPSPTPGACSDSCPLSSWCHPKHLILCYPLLLLPSVFVSIRAFSSESVLCIKWPKYWSFSFSFNPSNEYSGLISFRTDWFDLLAVQGTLKESSLVPQSRDMTISLLIFYSINISSVRLTMLLAVERLNIFQQTTKEKQSWIYH